MFILNELFHGIVTVWTDKCTHPDRLQLTAAAEALRCDSLCVLCHFQMLKLWRRDVPLSERLGEVSPPAAAPGLPPTAAPMGPNISWLPEAPLLSPDQPIFLMTPAAQAVSGFFVWTALILTCHQVTASKQHKEGGGLNHQVFNFTWYSIIYSAGDTDVEFWLSRQAEVGAHQDINWVWQAGVCVLFNAQVMWSCKHTHLLRPREGQGLLGNIPRQVFVIQSMNTHRLRGETWSRWMKRRYEIWLKKKRSKKLNGVRVLLFHTFQWDDVR